ncbi:PTS N-acetylgalactosamine transporter subunit IIC [Escherichia coli]|nr:PTS N-acetylgalactosamine transporter subunit IIC [Escherichia coli]EFB6061879.1 PTS N-acetylgalactosamine transporter subunit IIC [Escherichia coli]EFE9940703.1 PTS N-acetylgalactosamine transporter subunit IIC [Escherichia coli]EFG8125460.1 PTS N-acetylgalactosamine transporter subunit IIC [Escherichia coli]EFM2471182.1 PTS N-acetylgalactosamine transporter subunit IIC [Escherichia coli]
MHEITLLQGLSLAALVFVLGIDFWLEALFLFRPIIVCTLTGAILGDIQTGLITGGLTELAFAGLTPAGGVQPPNPIMAGLMTTVIAWSTGVDAKTAIGLGLPFSLLMQYVILFFYSAFSLFMTKADKCAKEADTAAFSRLNWTTMLIVASAYAVIAFLCTYLAQGAMQALVKAMPAWLTHGFEVAGGILPAVGFGLLLRVMFKAQYIPYLIAGFLFVCYIQVSNLLPVAVLGAGFAVYEFFNAKSRQQASFNYERMQAGGFTWAMLPILKKIYKDDKPGLSAAMKDNLEFINTHPNLVGFLMGLLISMEEKGENRDTIKGLKVALFGPIAGIGDAIFWFTLLPIMAGICSSFASQGNLLGPILFFAVYLLIFFLRVGWTHVGYSVGVKAIDKVRENSQMIARSATILGITVIGGLIASYVHINVVTSFAIDSTHSVALQQDFFDKVFPNILPMAYTLLMYYFLRVKKAHPVLLIGVTFVLSIVCSAFGIL